MAGQGNWLRFLILQANPRSRHRKIIGMHTISKVATLAILLPLAACSSGPGTTAEAFDTALAAGHSAEAIEYIDPSIKQIGGPKLMAALGKAGEGASRKGGLKTVTASDEKIEGDYATLKLNETFGNGSTSTSNMKLRRVDGKWYVTF